jgi:hypothetical protein
MIESVIRAARVLLCLTLVPLALTACGNEKVVVVGDREPFRPAPDRTELNARAEALGFSPDLVYVTEPPGFTLAKQSVGAYGDDGFASSYWSRESGARIILVVDRGTMTAENCPEQPVGQSAGERVTCVRDGDAWYRTSGAVREYALSRSGRVIRISGEAGTVTREVLHTAAEAARRPTDSELAYLLPPRHHQGPFDRGDLPPVGDGAPRDPEGTTG